MGSAIWPHSHPKHLLPVSFFSNLLVTHGCLLGKIKKCELICFPTGFSLPLCGWRWEVGRECWDCYFRKEKGFILKRPRELPACRSSHDIPEHSKYSKRWGNGPHRPRCENSEEAPLGYLVNTVWPQSWKTIVYVFCTVCGSDIAGVLYLPLTGLLSPVCVTVVWKQEPPCGRVGLDSQRETWQAPQFLDWTIKANQKKQLFHVIVSFAKSLLIKVLKKTWPPERNSNLSM